jgi:predicted RNA-binding protein with PUA domain
MRLNGQNIIKPKNPISKAPVMIGKVDTVASGKQVIDVIKHKWRFGIIYEGLRDISFNAFKEPYLSKQAVEFIDDEGNTYMVRVMSLTYSTHRLNPSLKQNVSIVLEEV